jgi:hypothetical protein
VKASLNSPKPPEPGRRGSNNRGDEVRGLPHKLPELRGRLIRPAPGSATHHRIGLVFAPHLERLLEATGSKGRLEVEFVHPRGSGCARDPRMQLRKLSAFARPCLVRQTDWYPICRALHSGAGAARARRMLARMERR